RTDSCCSDVGLWRGHRVLMIDGSGLSMPDAPVLRRAFGVPGRLLPGRGLAGLGFPVMHTLWLLDHATGLLIDFVVDRWAAHDMAHAHRLHTMLGAGPDSGGGDVLPGDRAFSSYAHLALLLQQNLHGVFRAHQRLIVDFTPGRRPRHQRKKRQRKGVTRSTQLKQFGKADQLVRWPKPPRRSRPAWMAPEDYEQLPAQIVVRELRYTVARKGFRTRHVTLVTTLTDPRKYPRQELAELYQQRWSIETNLRHLKQTMKMGVLRSKSVDGVMKELYAYAIAYNLVRRHRLQAAAEQGVPPERVSFIDALDALCHSGPTQLRVNPDRPHRDEPRVIKRAKDHYTYMTRPRDELRQALGIPRIAA
ncbi:MAG: IS4 family transposase, partial [Planctomycetota bacterium]